jgi:hypothetical protein
VLLVGRTLRLRYVNKLSVDRRFNEQALNVGLMYLADCSQIAQEKYSETTVAYDPPPMDSQHPTPSGTPGGSPRQSQLDLTQLNGDVKS